MELKIFSMKVGFKRTVPSTMRYSWFYRESDLQRPSFNFFVLASSEEKQRQSFVNESFSCEGNFRATKTKPLLKINFIKTGQIF